MCFMLKNSFEFVGAFPTPHHFERWFVLPYTVPRNPWRWDIQHHISSNNLYMVYNELIDKSFAIKHKIYSRPIAHWPLGTFNPVGYEIASLSTLELAANPSHPGITNMNSLFGEQIASTFVAISPFLIRYRGWSTAFTLTLMYVSSNAPGQFYSISDTINKLRNLILVLTLNAYQLDFIPQTIFTTR